MNLTDNARLVMEKRYCLRDKDGETTETPEGAVERVASYVAQGDKDKAWLYRRLLSDKKFLPNSPTWTGADTPLGQLAACFVLPVKDDMGGHPDGIFSTLRNAALIQQSGGGNGFAFSRLRHKGSSISRSNGRATGPVGFMRVYNKAFGEIAQGGTRRGANMAVLRVDHPDIEEFIDCKLVEGELANFNISVGLTDEFMEAVVRNEKFTLRSPVGNKPVREIDAEKLWKQNITNAHRNGEPGALFLDTANKANPLPGLGELEASNPCGEQFLQPYESCCLGSINLAEHVVANLFGEMIIDWGELGCSVESSVMFLNDVIDANAFVEAVPQLKKAALASRRIGLGIMGLADVLMILGIGYDTAEGRALADNVMEFIRFEAMQTSVILSRTSGKFPAWNQSIYAGKESNTILEYRKSIGLPDTSGESEHGMPSLDWNTLIASIRDHGLHNACLTTIAPTGTISTVAGAEGYGCEPVFALGYTRNMKDGDKTIQLPYTSQHLQNALADKHVDASETDKILGHVAHTGRLADYQGDLADEIRKTFVTSADIAPEDHVLMQAALQRWVDNSISKTINMPAGTTIEEVGEIYMLAWASKCKGITVYRESSRDEVILETHAEVERKNTPTPSVPQTKKPRPTRLSGCTLKRDTPMGKLYVTINADSDGEPFEVFMTLGKGGSEVSAVSEAIGRLISLILRSPSTKDGWEKLEHVIDELSGIGGLLQQGFGPEKTRSLADAVSKALRQYLDMKTEEVVPAELDPMIAGDICPDCGEATLQQIEGCAKCVRDDCGYAQC